MGAASRAGRGRRQAAGRDERMNATGAKREAGMAPAAAVGILGGTFDPIHNGHLHLAQELYRGGQFREIRILPVGTPPHRPPPFASAAHREAMVREAIADCEGLILDSRELRGRAPSYTVNTVYELRDEFEAAPLCLIVGSDAFHGFRRWRDWRRILKHTGVLVVDRPADGEDRPAVQPLLPAPLAELLRHPDPQDAASLRPPLAGQVARVAIGALDIGSTRLRRWLRGGRAADAERFLPPPVCRYIRQHRLYGA